MGDTVIKLRQYSESSALIEKMTMYQNSLISFGMSTTTLRTSRSNLVMHIGGMCLMLLKTGRICSTRNDLFPMQHFLVFFPAELLKTFRLWISRAVLGLREAPQTQQMLTF